MAVEAQKAGNIKLATYWQSVVAHWNATSTIKKIPLCSRLVPHCLRTCKVFGTC
jgi:hypothetical protein